MSATARPPVVMTENLQAVEDTHDPAGEVIVQLPRLHIAGSEGARCRSQESHRRSRPFRPEASVLGPRFLSDAENSIHCCFLIIL